TADAWPSCGARRWAARRSPRGDARRTATAHFGLTSYPKVRHPQVECLPGRRRLGGAAEASAMFRPMRSDEDFRAEVDAHLQLEIERLQEEGLSADEARAAARRAFGN